MNNIMSSSDIMLKVTNFSANAENSEIYSVWKKVVSKIKNYNTNDEDEMSLGEKLAVSTRVIDIKNGVLLVESDHPGWIQYLNFHKKFILKGIKMEVPDIKINSLAFRVSGSEINLSESYEDSLKKNMAQMERKLEAQEKSLRKYVEKEEEKNKESPEVPPELAAKFDSIIKNMLTNSENK
ncbi:MAG: DUF721 domain-containing protein [Treponema sp.]|nr:DUF721 domain-containing protein [Treponema sp.]